MPRCLSITKRNTQCGKWALPNSSFCECHVPKLEETPAPECIICFDTISGEDAIQLGCKHSYHKSCMAHWNGDCPLCRKPLSDAEVLSAHKHQFEQKLRDVRMFCGRDAARVLDVLGLGVDLCTTGSFPHVQDVLEALQRAQNVANDGVVSQLVQQFVNGVYEELQFQFASNRESDDESISIDVSVAEVPIVSGVPVPVPVPLPAVPGVPGVLGPVFDQMATIEQVVPVLVPVEVAPVPVMEQPQLAVGFPIITTLPPGMSVVERMSSE